MATAQAGDASVAARSAHLRKDLGLFDLTLTQILFVVGLPWVGVAAKQGPAHVVLWLVACAPWARGRRPAYREAPSPDEVYTTRRYPGDGDQYPR